MEKEKKMKKCTREMEEEENITICIVQFQYHAETDFDREFTRTQGFFTC